MRRKGVSRLLRAAGPQRRATREGRQRGRRGGGVVTSSAGPSRGRVGGAPSGVSSPGGAASLQPGSSPGASAAWLGKLEQEDRAQPWPKLSAPAAQGAVTLIPSGGLSLCGCGWRPAVTFSPCAESPPGCLTACPRCWEPHPVQARGRELHLVAGTRSHPERLQDPESHVGWGVLLGVRTPAPHQRVRGSVGWGEASPY